MNTKALLSTLFVLGSSTAALAKPASSWRGASEPSRATPVAPTVRDHRTPVPQPAMRDHRSPAPQPSVRDDFHVPQPQVRDHRYGDRDDRSRDRDRDDRYGDRDDVGWVMPAPVVQPAVDTCANVLVRPNASEYVGPVGYANPWSSWVALTEPTMIAHGSEQISVGAGRGSFSTLELVANSGETYVSQVVIEFANGEYQTVALGRELEPGEPSLVVDLAGNRRMITRIVVNGSSSFGARYSVLAV
jgi:hypothetical protein